MPPPLALLRALKDNFISIWPESAYTDDVTHVRFGLRHVFTANSPALAKHVLLDNAANYTKTPLQRRLLEPALGVGLLTSDGPVWKRHRAVVAPSFAPRRMAALVPSMADETLTYIEAWRRRSGDPINLCEALSEITIGVITRTMFGRESRADMVSLAADTATYQKAMRPGPLDFLTVPNWVPRMGTGPARIIANRLNERIFRVIERRREGADEQDDLLSLLLQSLDGNGLDLNEIRDEIATIVVAGHETTASALGWTFYLLDLHPEIERQVAAELRDVLRGRAATAQDIEHLRLTRMVAEEALRLYPPAHTVSRFSLAPDRLGDVPVPKGAVVLVSPWLLHRNPSIWPEPERFDPGRFDPARATEPRTRFSYIPFGAGARVCVGASFAMTEMVIVLATILQGWRLRLVPGQSVEPVGLLALRPRAPIKVIAEPRVHEH